MHRTSIAQLSGEQDQSDCDQQCSDHCRACVVRVGTPVEARERFGLRGADRHHERIFVQRTIADEARESVAGRLRLDVRNRHIRRTIEKADAALHVGQAVSVALPHHARDAVEAGEHDQPFTADIDALIEAREVRPYRSRPSRRRQTNRQAC